MWLMVGGMMVLRAEEQGLGAEFCLSVKMLAWLDVCRVLDPVYLSIWVCSCLRLCVVANACMIHCAYVNTSVFVLWECILVVVLGVQKHPRVFFLVLCLVRERERKQLKPGQ